jgi:hypothetical protein
LPAFCAEADKASLISLQQITWLFMNNKNHFRPRISAIGDYSKTKVVSIHDGLVCKG